MKPAATRVPALAVLLAAVPLVACRDPRFDPSELTDGAAVARTDAATDRRSSSGADTSPSGPTPPAMPAVDAGAPSGPAPPPPCTGPDCLPPALAVSAGGYHTCALVAGGRAYCWGLNLNGQLGDGTRDNSSVPVAVAGLSGATAIAASVLHTCALLASGQVSCWGGNTHSELGSAGLAMSSTPVPVPGLTGARAIAAGFAHTCAVVDGGAVRCWGSNLDDQLGGFTGLESASPVAVPGLTGATALAAGNRHACALLGGGAIRCWGSNFAVLPARESATSPLRPVKALPGATALAAGRDHTCALAAGNLHCWGDNRQGQLGDGSTTDATDPVAVKDVTGVTALAAGPFFGCAVLGDGGLRCWGGSNTSGELGDGTNLPRPGAVAVAGLTSARLVTTGGFGERGHACAIVEGGAVRCWASNSYGQLGNGSTSDSLHPVAVRGW
jgi:alpha-tubulin suppressor-like RCC1 family protein